MDVKEKIIIEAKTIFTNNGIKNVTMDYLASELRLSKRTIYQHFTDKDDLVSMVVNDIINDSKIAFKDIMLLSNNVVEAFFNIARYNIAEYGKMNRLFFEDLRKFYPAFRISESSEDGLKIITILINRAVEEGIIEKEINIGLISIFIEQIFIMAHSNVFTSFSKKEVFHFVLLAYMKGICTEKGRKIIEESSSNFYNQINKL